MENAETDCRAVLERLYLYIDGEIAGGACAEIEAHLQVCRGCLEHEHFERELKVLIRRKCGEGALPPALAERIQSIIRERLGGA